MKEKIINFDLAGRPISFRIGAVAQQATASVITQYGETTILTTVVVGKENSKLDYFPLSLEYAERLYAGGKIKGSRWVKREGRPTDEAVLTGRMIDRSVRPLFANDFRRDVQIINTLLSIDGKNSPDIVAALSTACALSVCDIPWNGPIATTRIGYVAPNGDVKGHYMVNPTSEEEALSLFDLVVSSNKNEVVMIECKAEQVNNEAVVTGISEAVSQNAKIVTVFEKLRSELGISFKPQKSDEELVEKIVHKYEKELKKMLSEMADKENVGGSGMSELEEKITKEFELEEGVFSTLMPALFKKTMKKLVFKDQKRADGRAFDEVRPLSAQVGVVPRVHGSALFSRGATQVLSIATLGPLSMQQWIEDPEGQVMKRYIHHYSMPPYSVGETGRIGSPSRREIGHGALAEKGVEVLLPDEEKFPYTVRVVSEVLSSNGSTSMASTCGSSLALMDAGVPMGAHVGGIAIGIVRESQDKYQLLTDIIGIEDFFGEMDFKVAGTRKGITAIQLDVKNMGLTHTQIVETVKLATDARMKVLDVMDKALSEPRTSLSQYAPRVVVLTPPEDKIGEIIGPGGKNIKKIIADTGCEIDIDDSGKVSISGINKEKVEMAIEMIKSVYKEYAIGTEFDAHVLKMFPFGALVEVAPGKEGLLHVSRMGMGFVKDASNLFKEGDPLRVKLEEKDERGKLRFALVKDEDKKEEVSQS
ncbi:MAG: polyribonucleotide nucleotidyltransferase [Candidatus Roizmanbacteria bacterium]|nr:polyribonucleotide nucleotidyltransferase [Candidatus Roizmanbacteria bacterium]